MLKNEFKRQTSGKCQKTPDKRWSSQKIDKIGVLEVPAWLEKLTFFYSIGWSKSIFPHLPILFLKNPKREHFEIKILPLFFCNLGVIKKMSISSSKRPEKAPFRYFFVMDFVDT